MISLRAVLLATSFAALSSGANAACNCGYSLSAYSNAYFRHQFLADFTTSKLSGTATSADWLDDYGFFIGDGFQSGGQSNASDHTTPIASFKNVRIQNGVLQLVVPGGQKITNGGTTSVAEIEGPGNVINGVFTMNAKIDATPGTCQSMFTYHDSDVNAQDEQDIEILSSYLYNTGSNGTPPGIELTNYDPSDPENKRNDNRIDPFIADPAAAFHNYTIAWLPSATTYYMDQTALNSPTKYYSKNASTLVLNHWTNGDPGFTQGPPTKEAVMQIKYVVGYYTQSGESGLPSGCSQSQVCKV